MKKSEYEKILNPQGIEEKDFVINASKYDAYEKILDVLGFEPRINENRNSGGHSWFWAILLDSSGNYILFNSQGRLLNYLLSNNVSLPRITRNLSVSKGRIGRQHKETSQRSFFDRDYAKSIIEWLGTYKRIDGEYLLYNRYNDKLSIGKVSSGYFTEKLYVIPRKMIKEFGD